MRSHTSCTSASRWLQRRTVFALLLEREDQVLHLACANRIQAGGGLVEQDQIGIVNHRLRQPDAPGHALGILAELAFAAFWHRGRRYRAASGRACLSVLRSILKSLP